MRMVINSLAFLLLVFSGCGSSNNCTPDCTGKVCGPDPVCGESCGTCTGGETCDAQGQCVSICTPSCAGRECGPDGCGGTCAPGCGAGEWCNNGTCEVGNTNIVWIQIPGGTFQMGSTTGDADELPVHQVTVSSFEMSKTEVTVDQYQACVDAGTCTLPEENASNFPGSLCNWGASGRGAHPVNCVHWDQAVTFCAWAGGRLPSEAEWEYADRSGGQDITYPWGDDTATCQYAVMDEGGYGCGQGGTWASCGKTAGNTAQGLCDMAGNVYEWVQDWCHSDYTGAPTDGSAWLDSSSGPTSRVSRGGSFAYDAGYLRAANRHYGGPSDLYYDIGFRCAW